MSILQTSCVKPSPGGGIANVEYHLIAGLKKRGYQVKEYFPKIKSSALTDFTHGILPLKGAEVIHSHTNISWHTMGAFRTFHGCTALGAEIADTEGDRVLKKGMYFKVNSFLEDLSANTNYCLPVSQYVADALVKYYKVNPIMIQVVPNGVDTDTFYPCKTCGWEMREEHGIPKDAFVISWTGGWDFNKGAAYLKEVVDYCKDNKNIWFFIRSSVESEIPEQHKWVLNTPNVKYIPYGNDMVDFYNASDVFLTTATYDPMPLSVLEAMSCEKPVICPNSGGHAEVIQPGINGYVVNSYKDTKNMADIILWLSKDRKACKELSKYARKRILSKYTIDHMVNNYLAAYVYFKGNE